MRQKISKNRQKPRRRTENTVRFQQWGECRGGLGRDRGAFWGPTSSEHIYNRKNKGVGGQVGVSFGSGFICIDPQDSDGEQLEIEGTEHKVWAYYIRCCLQGNVVLVITVCQGKQNEQSSTSLKNIKQKGIRE